MGQANKSRDKNFIQRNINYVTKLNYKAKERKGLHACRSFIDIHASNKQKPSTAFAAIKVDESAANEPTKMKELEKYSDQAPKLSRFAKDKSLKRI